MDVSKIRKYAFDTEFASDGGIVRAGDNGAPKRLTPEEIEAERLNAFERGKRDALVAAERDTAAALQHLADAASAILTRLDAESRAMRDDATRIALAAARKIAGASLDAFGIERVTAAIEAAMDALRHQPRLLVKLSPEAADALRERITGMTQSHAYAGSILIRAEPDMKAGQVSIDWSDGVVHLDPAEAATRIEHLIEAALAAANTAQE
ncbi:MAG: FliH/SctL family protein [Terricaulis sp.]